MKRKWKALLSILVVLLIVFNSGTVGMAYTPDLSTSGMISGTMRNIQYASDNNDSTYAEAYSISTTHYNHRKDEDVTTTSYYNELIYDFGVGKEIRRFAFLGTGTPVLQYSDNNSAWTTANMTLFSNTPRMRYNVLAMGAHRYWRIFPGSVQTVNEIEMMEASPAYVAVGTSPVYQQGTAAVFNLAVNCPDYAITAYYNVDGGATQTVGTVNDAGTFNTLGINTTGLANGSHTLNAWAINSQGDRSSTATTTFIYNIALPSFTVTSPTLNQGFSSKPGFSVLTLKGTVSCPWSTITTFYNIDGVNACAVAGTVINEGSFTDTNIDISQLTEGTHLLGVWDNSSQGFCSGAKVFPFKVDRTAPVITKLGATTAATSITVLTEATDAVTGLAVTSCRYAATAVGKTTVDSGWVSPTAYTLTGLAPNTTYSIRQQVRDAVDNISEQTVNVTTRAQVPALDVKTKGNTADITITDFNPAPTTQYKIMSGSKFVDQNGQLTASPTWITLPGAAATPSSPIIKKITVTGLNSNLGYGFRASAMGTDGIETELSDTRIINPVAPPPSAPTLLKAVAKTNEITVYWDPIAEAEGYLIEIDGVEAPTPIVSKTEYTHSIAGTKPTTHKYRIKSYKTDLSKGNDTNTNKVYSLWSEYVSATTVALPPVAPTNLTLVPHATSIALNWDTVAGATGYELLMDGVVKEVGYKLLYTNKHLSPDTLHTYAVRAKNAAGYSPWTEFKIVRTTATIPAIPTINFNRITNTQATVAWDEGMDAESYDVEVDGVISDCGIYNFCMKSYLKPMSTHVFRARAKNAIGESAWSQPVSITTYLLDTPQNVSIIEEDTKLSLKWKGVPDAEKYILSLNGVETDMGKVEAYEVKDLTPETEYKVKIKALSAAGTGNWTDERTVHSLPTRPAKPQNISLLVVPNYVSLSWDAVEGANTYDVELDGIVIDNDTATTYIDEALEPNTTHNFRVRAKNTAIESEWSDNKIVTTLNAVPAAPVAIQISTTKNIASIMWDKVLGAIGYNIEVDGTEIVLGDNNVYTHRRLVEGTEHRYRLKSKFVNGDSPWTGDIINNSILAICKKSKTVDLGLTAQDISDFSKYTLTVTYDPKAITVADLCTLSSGIELNVGKVKGTDIWIKEFKPGKIVFVATKVVNQGESWTGVINSIKFNAKVSGRTAITYTVFTAADSEE